MDVRRWIRFAAGGAANTAITYAAYLALVQVLPYLAAYAIAYAAGIVIAFLINSALVFRVPMTRARFFAYPSIYLVQYLIAAGLLAFCIELLKVPEAMAPLAVIVAMIPVSYLLNKLILARLPGTGLPGSSR